MKILESVIEIDKAPQLDLVILWRRGRFLHASW